MKIQKIVTWIAFIIFISILSYFFYSEKGNEIQVMSTMMGLLFSSTYLIHIYAFEPKAKQVIKYLWVCLLVIIVLSFLGLIIFKTNLALLSLFLSSILFFLASLYFVVSYRKVDFAIMILMIVSLLGLFFKSQHWVGASTIMAIGWVVPAILFLFIYYQKIKEYDARTNKFLTFFMKLISGTLTLCFLGITFKFQHWPGANILKTSALPSLIISILCLMFLLPNSNFIEWTKEHKRMFYRAILIPVLYMCIMTSLIEVFPGTFGKIFFTSGRIITNGFNLQHYEIPYKDGL